MRRLLLRANAVIALTLPSVALAERPSLDAASPAPSQSAVAPVAAPAPDWRSSPVAPGTVVVDPEPLAAAVAAASDDEPADASPSKKARLLADKQARRDVRLDRAPVPGPPPAPPLTLFNVWTHEALPVDVAHAPSEQVLDRFLRCHYTNQATAMDARLLPVVEAAAKKFGAGLVEVVSGYRAPKYNLMLRKKGHEVARDSQHSLGHAVDFRVPGLPTRKLLAFVKSLRLGGVGFYPESAFVHTDVGRVRYWRGH